MKGTQDESTKHLVAPTPEPTRKEENMRYNKSRQKRVSLADFIVDSICDTGWISEDIPITEIQSWADKVCEEVKAHIQAALEDIDLDEVVA